MPVRPGMSIDLLDNDDAVVESIKVGISIGWFELHEVSHVDGRVGVVAFARDGSWWWVRELAFPEPSGL